MRPTIEVEDTCIANPFAYSSEPVQRFDIIVFQGPEEVKKRHNVSGELRLLKRVIGLPNEKLEIKDNKIYINDTLLEEPFEKIVDEKDQKRNLSAIIIPNNEYFVLGDNRPNSEDSRWWTKPTISKVDILGKIVQIIHKNE